jgi:hypothetical protein
MKQPKNHILGEPATETILAQHADAIRALGKRVIGDIIEIGQRLTDAKQIAGHGNWLPWLEREFGWTEMTATRFINVYEMSKSNNLLDLDVPVSGLYMLAAPGTPDEARTEMIERAETGEKVSVADVKRSIDTAKGREQPAREAATKDPETRGPKKHTIIITHNGREIKH